MKKTLHFSGRGRRALALASALLLSAALALPGCSGKSSAPKPKYDPQESASALAIEEKNFPKIAVQSDLVNFTSWIYEQFYPTKNGVQHDVSADDGNAALIEALKNKTFDLALLRAPTAQELSELSGIEGVTVTRIASDALVFFVSQKCWVTDISSAQAQACYFGGESDSLSPVDIDAATLSAFPYVAAMRQTFLTSGGGTFASGVLVPDSSSGYAQAVEQQAEGDLPRVGFGPYSTLGIYNTFTGGEKGGIRVLRLDGVRPTFESIASGEYPGGVDTYVAWRAEDTGSTQKLADWLLSDSVQETAVLYGLGRLSASPQEESVQTLPDGAPVPNVTVADNGSYPSGVYVINGDYAYFNFGGYLPVGEELADVLASFAGRLKGQAEVYDVLVPTNAEFYRPYARRAESKSQWTNIQAIYEKMEAGGVHTVDAYSQLAAHADEYVYFRTDHHWTGLGAYYAYRAFCEKAGLTAQPLSDWETRTKEGFLGSSYNDTGDKNLKAHPDTVDYYITCASSAQADFVDRAGNTFTHEYPWSEASAGSNSYGVFIWADNPYYHCSTGAASGRSALLVKESFGNAFAPFLFSQYSDVYVVDFRYWTGSLADLVAQKGIDTVIFLNNTFSANTQAQVEKIAAIAK